MADYDIKDVHDSILQILLAVDKVCRAHDLEYYIWAGTMIGAVRHKGFIPWDDDLDIAMPRESYDILMKNAAEWLPERYEMVCAETDRTYPLPFAKIQDAETTLIERAHLKYVGGIYIDVFPIDGAPHGWLKQKLHFGRYEYFKRVLYFLYRDPFKHGHGISCWIPLLCRKLYTLKGVQNEIRRILKQYDYARCNLVADYDDGSKGIMKKTVLGTPAPYQFENNEVMGVEDYDTYLGNKYGDYMTLPPQGSRRQHNFHYLDLHHPYRKYKDGEENRPLIS